MKRFSVMFALVLLIASLEVKSAAAADENADSIAITTKPQTINFVEEAGAAELSGTVSQTGCKLTEKVGGATKTTTIPNPSFYLVRPRPDSHTGIMVICSGKELVAFPKGGDGD